eukprot:COSAG02_NODE_12301_length_1566_cov_0.712338_1_plen_259_part_00
MLKPIPIPQIGVAQTGITHSKEIQGSAEAFSTPRKPETHEIEGIIDAQIQTMINICNATELHTLLSDEAYVETALRHLIKGDYRNTEAQKAFNKIDNFITSKSKNTDGSTRLTTFHGDILTTNEETNTTGVYTVQKSSSDGSFVMKYLSNYNNKYNPIRNTTVSITRVTGNGIETYTGIYKVSSKEGKATHTLEGTKHSAHDNKSTGLFDFNFKSKTVKALRHDSKAKDEALNMHITQIDGDGSCWLHALSQAYDVPT